MPQELILKIHDTTPAREINVPVGRCSLGRSADSDVMIDLVGISRRHAVIGHYIDGAELSDCNSQNGTFVNGKQVAGSMMLNDGDVISLGSVCEITIRMCARETESAISVALNHPVSARILGQKPEGVEGGTSEVTVCGKTVSAQSKKFCQSKKFWLMAPKVALASIALIVILAIVGIIAVNPVERAKKQDGNLQSSTPNILGVRSPSPPPAHSGEAEAFERLENELKQLMRRISSDSQAYALPDRSPLGQIKDTLNESCRAPGVAEALQTINQNRREFVKMAGNQITPDLLAYALLAETNGSSQNLMATARSMAPKLISLRKTFGGTTADSVLILIAAYPEGIYPRGQHPLLDRIPADNPMQDRNIWTLKRRNKFKPGQYEFVLRFIAYGIIADNPALCGI